MDAWDETRSAAEHWAAAVEGLVTAAVPDGAPGNDAATQAAIGLDEAMPSPFLSAPPPPPPPASTSEGEGGLHVMRAPVLDDGASLLEHPDLVWAEDTWDEAREAEAKEMVARQGATLPSHRVQWYERTAGRHWDLFYKRNQDRFFKDRHYLLRDFPDLVPPPSSPSLGANDGGVERGSHPPTPPPPSTVPPPTPDDAARPQPGHTVLVEAGCGVGNAVFPLLESHPHMFVYALDFSARAIELVKQHPLYATTPRRCRAFVCDLVNDPVPAPIVEEGGGADLVLCMYSLSAMAPEAMPEVARKLHSILKPGGRVLLRDYGRWDEAQLRFKRGHKLADNFYLRSDGTRAYYFALDDLRRIFVQEAGFVEVEAGFIRRQYANRGQGATRRRTWVHARFEKPRQGQGQEEDGPQ